MDESDLKRYLIRSLRAQGGYGFRIEDRYAVGRPDCYMHAEKTPPFWVEAKMLKDRASLFCTERQAAQIKDLHRPPLAYAVIVGWSEKLGALYIGQPGDKLKTCRFVPRPRVLDSSEWLITELLGKFYHDRVKGVVTA